MLIRSARAYSNVVLPTRLVTANEHVTESGPSRISYPTPSTQNASNSITSSLPSSPPAPVDQESESFPGPSTQNWQEWINSSQGQILDSFTATNHDVVSPKLKSATSQESPSPRILRVDNRDGQHANSSPLHLRIEDVPVGASNIYCVRRGYVPGFYFDEPSMPPPSQYKAFNEFCYQVFKLEGHSTPATVAEANAYMTHKPEECKTAYQMCHVECRRQVKAQDGDGSDEPSQQLQQMLDDSQNEAPLQLTQAHCSACDRVLHCNKALLCKTCASDPHADPDIDFCARMFSLCEEQRNVLKQAALGHKIFYTG